MVVERPNARHRIQQSFRVHPAVALLGARQCGKSTLARLVAADEPVAAFFDLERAVDQRRLAAPEDALAPLTGLVVIDEIQRQPALLETLRVLLDRPAAGARFLLLGSSSPALTRTASETLAGRVGRVDLSGFDLRRDERGRSDGELAAALAAGRLSAQLPGRTTPRFAAPPAVPDTRNLLKCRLRKPHNCHTCLTPKTSSPS